jgi:CRISPR system Cascade subunit CasA
LNNTITTDLFSTYAQLDSDADIQPMWVTAMEGNIYQAQKIGLIRGLFALAYHIGFQVEDQPCRCDVCGSYSDQSVNTFTREKYSGRYGSTKTGRDAGAGWWLHPYTPRSIKEDGTYPVCARGQNWQSWQELSSYVIGKETDKTMTSPAFVVRQYQEMGMSGRCYLLVGGNIADQGSILGRVYDLFSMPSELDRNLSKVTQVVDAGLIQKEKISQAMNKMFGAGYEKRFIAGIKEQVMNRFISNSQQIIQNTLLDVDRKEASALRKSAVNELKIEARKIYSDLQRKYQHDLPLFKALVKGEYLLYKD